MSKTKVTRPGQKLKKITNVMQRGFYLHLGGTQLETAVFSLLHYHGPFGVLFPAGGIIVRIFLVKLCVIGVCLLYDLKQKGRRR